MLDLNNIPVIGSDRGPPKIMLNSLADLGPGAIDSQFDVPEFDQVGNAIRLTRIGGMPITLAIATTLLAQAPCCRNVLDDIDTDDDSITEYANRAYKIAIVLRGLYAQDYLRQQQKHNQAST